MNVGIIGYGYVGKAQHGLIGDKHTVWIYDPALGKDSASKAVINKCDIVFISVPTPMGKDGSCDTSIVEDVALWLTANVAVIQSTVAPEFTESLNSKYGDRFVFQPEYFGETVGHVMMDKNNRTFVTLGGSRKNTNKVAEFYQTIYNANVHIAQTDSTTAEIVKYMENSFFATKVTFVNEFYEIAKTFGRDFHEIRELWLLDPRVTRSHTFVYPTSRGYGGKCLPKDVSAIIKKSEAKGYDPKFLKAVKKSNERIRKL